MKIAVIGLGHAAQHQIAALKMNTQAQLVALCDTDAGKSTWFPHVPFYTNVHELLSAQRLDAAIVSTPAPSHFEIARLLLSAGVNVLVEKPATIDLEQLMELDTLSRQCGRLMHVSLHAAFGVEVTWALAYLREHGLVDAVESARAVFMDPYFTRGRLREGAASLGGSWLDSGINALSVLDRFFDLASPDFRLLLKNRESVEGLDLRTFVEFEAGPRRNTIAIETNWLLSINSKTTELKLPDRSLLLEHTEEAVYLLDNGSPELLFKHEAQAPRLENHYSGVVSDFIRAVSLTRDNREVALRLHTILFNIDAMLKR